MLCYILLRRIEGRLPIPSSTAPKQGLSHNYVCSRNKWCCRTLITRFFCYIIMCLPAVACLAAPQLAACLFSLSGTYRSLPRPSHLPTCGGSLDPAIPVTPSRKRGAGAALQIVVMPGRGYLDARLLLHPTGLTDEKSHGPGTPRKACLPPRCYYAATCLVLVRVVPSAPFLRYQYHPQHLKRGERAAEWQHKGFLHCRRGRSMNYQSCFQEIGIEYETGDTTRESIV